MISRRLQRRIVCRRGFSLLEVVASLLITSVLLTAAVRTITASRAREAKTLNQMHEYYLANDLLNEVQLQAFSEPTAVPVFGPEPGETRSSYDDVDDYNGYTESPPCRRDGSAISGFSTLTRTVSVTWVSDSPPHATATSDTGLKRIEVTIKRSSTVLLKLSAYRSAGFQNGAKP